MKLKVILLDKVPRLGNKNDVLAVAKGYAMNYLLPQGLARPATKQEEKVASERLEREQGRLADMIAQAQELKAGLAGKEVTLQVKTSDKGHLYGSVSEKDVAEAIKKEHNMDIAESAIDMSAIKELGDYTVTVHFAENVEASVVVHVTEEA